MEPLPALRLFTQSQFTLRSTNHMSLEQAMVDGYHSTMNSLAGIDLMIWVAIGVAALVCGFLFFHGMKKTV